jgi:hypothetical protein
MGYSTFFKGNFQLTPALNTNQIAYLQRFSATRRMQRDPAQLRSDIVREAVGLPVGEDAEFFVGGEGDLGQASEQSIVNFNQPPASQPSLLCQWTVDDTGSSLYHNESEKFEHYLEWLDYLIDRFLKPWGIHVNGKITWQGDSGNDVGEIIIYSNQVRARKVNIDNFCKIWAFADAPFEYQELSQHGGDEDWIIFAPNGFDANYLVDRLTVCDSQEYPVDGGTIYITAH